MQSTRLDPIRRNWKTTLLVCLLAQVAVLGLARPVHHARHAKLKTSIEQAALRRVVSVRHLRVHVRSKVAVDDACAAATFALHPLVSVFSAVTVERREVPFAHAIGPRSGRSPPAFLL